MNFKSLAPSLRLTGGKGIMWWSTKAEVDGSEKGEEKTVRRAYKPTLRLKMKKKKTER